MADTLRKLGMRLALILCPALLGGCAAMPLAAVEALTVSALVGTATAIATGEGEGDGTEIYGAYRDGHWFDRDLFDVRVVADTPAQAQRMAQATALDACWQRKKAVEEISTDAWQERHRLIPVKIQRYSHSIRFRCRSVSASD